MQEWGADIEREIDETDNEILYLSQYLQNAEMKSENEKREKEKIRLNEQREEELYFEKRKLEQQASLGSNADKAANPEPRPEQAKVSSVKMPKIIISKHRAPNR